MDERRALHERIAERIEPKPDWYVTSADGSVFSLKRVWLWNEFDHNWVARNFDTDEAANAILRERLREAGCVITASTNNNRAVVHVWNSDPDTRFGGPIPQIYSIGTDWKRTIVDAFAEMEGLEC